MTVLHDITPYTQPVTTAAREDVCETNCVHPETVTQVRAQLPDDSSVEDATAFRKLIAEPSRFKIVAALQFSELCVCDLAAVVGVSESSMSHQLRLLRAGRVVTSRKDGRVAYYRLLDQHVTTTIHNALVHVRE